MSQDESKFDTMRLIQGAETSDLYSLESIMQEFSDSPKQIAEEPSEEKAIQSEVPIGASEQSVEKTAEEPRESVELVELEESGESKESKESKPQEPVEHSEEILPMDENQLLPAYENLSESQMADAIAQAVARSLDNGVPQAAAPEAEERPAEMSALKQPKQPEPMPQQPPIPSAPEPKMAAEPVQHFQRPEQTPVGSTESEPVQMSVEQKVQKSAAKATAAKKPDQKGIHPQTGQQKIHRSHVKAQTSTSEYIGDLIKELRRRQSMALPKPGTSLRGTEKRLSTFVGFERALSPVRYGILLLMLLCIGGRTVEWMTLGFMRGATAITVSLIAVIVAMIASWQSVVRGIRDLWYCRASYETVLLLTTVMTAVEALAMKNQQTYLPLIAISWALTGTAEYMHDQASLHSLRAVITGRSRVGIRTAANKWEHTDVIGKAPVTTAGFVRHQAQPDVWHSGMGIFLPVSMPVSLALCCARPYNLLSRALRGRGAVAGWFGMQGLSGKKAMLVYDTDLFPSGTMQQMGVRAYLPIDPRELVSMGASMALRANVGFQAVFTKLLRDMNGEIYDVARFQIQETGLEGYIHQQLVHLGSYQYMQLMGVTLPKRAPKYGVYIAVNRELAGLFGVKYQVSNGAVGGFRRVVREPRLTPLLVTRNFCVNPGFVEHWFKAPVTQMGCPKAEVRRVLSEPSLLTRGVTCGFVLREGINDYSRTVAGARRVYRMGLWLTVATVLLGLVLAVQTIMAIASGGAVIPAQRLVILNLIVCLVIEVLARIAVRG